MNLRLRVLLVVLPAIIIHLWGPQSHTRWSTLRETWQKFIHNQVSDTDFIEHLKISYHPVSEKPFRGCSSQNFQPSLFKFDLIVSPGVKAQFARPGDPAQLQFNGLTDLSATITPGLQFNGQWIFPLYNEFQRGQGRSRLGQVYFSQFFRLPSSTFFCLSGGLFDYGCYGVSTQLKRFFWQDRLGLSARLDYLQIPTFSAYWICPEYRIPSSKIVALTRYQPDWEEPGQ